MKIAVLRERKAGELRVAATSDAVKKFIGLGAQVAVESGAGTGAAIADAAYAAAGATVADASTCTNGAAIILKVRAPEKEELMLMPEGALLIGMLDPHADRD